MFGLGLLGAPWSIAALFFGSPNETMGYAALFIFPLLNAWLIWRLGWKDPQSDVKNLTVTEGPISGISFQLSAEWRRIIWVIVIPFVLFLFFWWLINFKNAYGTGIARGLFLAQITILLNTWVLFMKKLEWWTVIASPIVLTGVALVLGGAGRHYGFIPTLYFGVWLFLLIVIYGVSLYLRLKGTGHSQIVT